MKALVNLKFILITEFWKYLLFFHKRYLKKSRSKVAMATGVLLWHPCRVSFLNEPRDTPRALIWQFIFNSEGDVWKHPLLLVSHDHTVDIHFKCLLSQFLRCIKITIGTTRARICMETITLTVNIICIPVIGTISARWCTVVVGLRAAAITLTLELYWKIEKASDSA